MGTCSVTFSCCVKGLDWDSIGCFVWLSDAGKDGELLWCDFLVRYGTDGRFGESGSGVVGLRLKGRVS